MSDREKAAGRALGEELSGIRTDLRQIAESTDRNAKAFQEVAVSTLRDISERAARDLSENRQALETRLQALDDRIDQRLTEHGANFTDRLTVIDERLARPTSDPLEDFLQGVLEGLNKK